MSIMRYPARMASATARSQSVPAVRKVPKPSMGMDTPSAIS